MDPWIWMHEYANSWRTGHDHHDNWDSTSGIIEINAELGVYPGKTESYSNPHSYVIVSPHIGPGGWNDPDFLMTGGQVNVFSMYLH